MRCIVGGAITNEKGTRSAMDRKVPQPPLYADRPLPDLLRQLSTDTSTLVGQELRLARAELTQTAKKAAASATGFGAAAALGLGAFGALTTALIAALALAVPLWLAALVVAIVYGGIAFVAMQAGKKALQAAAPPVAASVESIKEDVDAVRAGVQRGR